MTQQTDLNVTPYYDDFSADSDYHRVLFCPGKAVQARELTQLQTILQNQIEQFGRHMFEEGTVIIPGQVGYDNNYYALKLQSTYSSAVSDYLSSYVDTIITGATSKVKAKVVGYAVATTDDPDTLFIKYTQTGTDNATIPFQDAENISSSGAVGSFSADVASATTAETSAAVTGFSVSVQEGIFFVRGNFVRAATQTLVLEKYSSTPSYRVGFNIEETLVTPEDASELLDNAAGATNYAAKGAHRLKITLTLAKYALTVITDSNFIELLRVENGLIKKFNSRTEYSVIENMIARRTDEESGDYIVKPFSIEPREHLNDGISNLGIYTSANGGDSSKWSIGVAPGKAYVRGREVETLVTKYNAIDKPRTTKSVNNDNIPFSLGSYVIVDTVYGQPDITAIGTDSDPFKTVSLYDTQTSSGGSSSGTLVGVARSRAFENASGTIGAAAATWQHYLFDINMLDTITMSGSVTLAIGVKITGVTSGATGYTYAAVSGTGITVIHRVGTFQTGEEITSSSAADTISGSPTISTTVTKQFGRDVKQLFMANTSGAGSQYTANCVLGDTFTLSGTYRTETTGTDNLIGVSGYSTAEVAVGDIVTIPTGTAGATEERTVDAVTATAISFSTAPSTDDITTANVIRNRVALQEQEELVTIYKMPKDNVASLLTAGVSDTTYSIRRQFIATTNSSGVASLAAGSNETFDSYAARDCVATILTAGSGSGSAGDVVTLSGKLSGTGSASLTVTDNTIFGNGAEIKVTATLTKSTSTQKSKTAQVVQTDTFTLNSASNNVYGQRVGDKEISLGVCDAYKLHAVYESGAIGTTPTLPTLTIASATGTLTAGEVITGSSSAATGRVVVDSNPSLTFVVLTGTFTTLDTISGGTSGKTAKVSAVATGSTLVTNRFTLDTGQRDSFYDISRIVRKPGAVTPTGQLLVVFDYFTHGAGDYFSVDSYGIDYKDIPEYTATKINPDTLVPQGQYPLRDCLDFRPRVLDLSNSGSVTGFAFNNRLFEGTGSSAGDVVRPDDNVRVDYTFYLPRNDVLYLTETGILEVVSGVPDENPVFPSMPVTNAMRLANIELRAYGFDFKRDVVINRINNKGYRMSDIASLEKRISNLEYYTSLTLLEKDTQSFQIQNENGLDRFKSGFIVDNFSGHSVGDVLHSDYKAGVDMKLRTLRAPAYLDNVLLIEEDTTDAARTTNGYQKTGDLLTLPYTHEIYIEQPYASRVESVNPFMVTFWIGKMDLNPETDVWIDTKTVPAVTVDVEGDYAQMLHEHADSLGEAWGSWNVNWTGNEVFSEVAGSIRSEGGWRGNQLFGRATEEAMTSQTRSGTLTTIVEKINNINTGERVISLEVIPWMRSRDVQVTVSNMKPNTRVYAFFDDIDVNAHVKPTGASAGGTTLNGAHTKIVTTITVADTTGFPATGTLLIDSEQMTYTGTTSTTFTGVTRATNGTTLASHATSATVSGAVLGNALISDSFGRLYATFTVPNTDSLKFAVGTKQFRLTSSSVNSYVTGVAETAAMTSYTATGHVETRQDLIVAVRNAEIVVTAVEETENRLFQRAGALRVIATRPPPAPDPLAQSVLLSQENGMFMTKVDVFFSAKDSVLPVTLDLRTMKNGVPTTTIIPFSSVTLNPDDVNISATAATATTFTFPSPVYIQDGQEFAIVLSGNSADYKAWISRMGEIDIGGTRAISEQPNLGTLFKSQNASTWNPSQYEDLKFTLYRANFTTGTGSIPLINQELTSDSGHIDTLTANPLLSASGARTVRVLHKNHGMHDTDNNVTIAGVISDIADTAANGTISSSVSSIVCDDISNFPSAGTVKIDDEIIEYTGKTSTTTLTGCVRTGDNVAHEDNSIVELYMFAGIPLDEINKTHTSISGIELDSYIITASTTNATSSITGGGSKITATRNVPFDTVYPLIQTMTSPDTSISTTVQTTTGTTIGSTQNSFARTALASAYALSLNKNNDLVTPQIVASQINETNELSGAKSFRLTTSITSSADNVSPVIDTQRMSIITASNRLNNIDDAGDIGTLSNYVASTEPEGDNNGMIYMTKKVTLESPATALRVILDAVNYSSSEVLVLYKILRTDSSDADYDDLGWTFFNSTGIPDSTVPVSKNNTDFKAYKYTAGKADDGTGTALDEFIAFSIKIVMQSTNSAEAPLVKDFRVIALAT